MEGEAVADTGWGGSTGRGNDSDGGSHGVVCQ